MTATTSYTFSDVNTGESVPYAEMIADGKDYEENVVNSMLAQQIFESLGSREKHIFTMFFVENRTQSEISKALGISQSYVSRIISSMGKMKRKGRKTK